MYYCHSTDFRYILGKDFRIHTPDECEPRYFKGARDAQRSCPIGFIISKVVVTGLA